MPDANRKRIEDPERLRKLHELNLLDTEPEPAFDRLTRLASRLLDVPVSLVSLVDRNRQFFKSKIGLDEDQTESALSTSYCQHVVDSGHPLIVEDAREHPLLNDNLAIEEFDAISYAGFPLLTKDGYTLGTLCVLDHKPTPWTEDQLAILKDLCDTAITEIELRAEVNERRKIEAQLNESVEELQALYSRVSDLEQLKTEMIRIAAHDLRNPLTSMTGLIDVLLTMSPDPLTEDQRDLINGLQESVAQMSQIIADLLSLQRIEAMASKNGNLPTLPLDALIEMTAESYRSDAEKKKLDYSVKIEARDLQVRGDEAQLREALINLINNAIKYTPEGGDIQIKLRRHEGHALVSVTDSGLGIPGDQQQNLFKPFFRAQTPETVQIDGTGLGLSLVKSIIERHGGSVRFSSQHGQGSTFRFSLPLYDEDLASL
jgi:signal transduction histidine kinase